MKLLKTLITSTIEVLIGLIKLTFILLGALYLYETGILDIVFEYLTSVFNEYK